MCGIVGVVGERTGIDTRAMLSAIAHRGPDDEGEYASATDAPAPVWLGHRRLAIIDPTAAGHQPMHTGDHRHSIVFNGEIYNFRELRPSLSDFQPRTGTDTEILLECLAREGRDTLPRLRGMFAFALWDARRSTLLLARDRHGEKPLYYYHDKHRGRLLFASEVRALLASNAVPRRLDPDGLDSYLCMGSVVDPYTLVRDLHAVPAGGAIEFGPQGLREHRYWTLADRPVNQDLKPEDAVARTRELLVNAQRRCLVADVPVGVLLSGGIDSTVNLALMAGLREPGLRSFSVVFDGADSGISEERYSDLAARRFETQHHKCSLSLTDARAFLDQAVASMDQPSHDGLNTYAVSEAVRTNDLKVAISGQAADELFLGYPQRNRFPALQRKAALLPAPIAQLITSLRRGIGHGIGRRYAKLLTAAAAQDAAAGAYLALHAMFSQEAVEQLRGEKRPHPGRFIERVGGDTALDRLSRLQLRHYLRDTLLRDADQMSMAHGLEIRAPYLDQDLVDFLLSVPACHKVERDRNKPLLLDAAGDQIPREIWDRPKRGFSMPVGRWILDGLAPPRETDIPGLDSRAVAAVRRCFSEQGPAAPFRYMQAWTLDVLGAWLKRHKVS